VFLDFLEVGYTEKLTVTKAEPQIEFLAAREPGPSSESTGRVAMHRYSTSPIHTAGSDNRYRRLRQPSNLRLTAAGFRRLRCALSSGCSHRKR